MSTVHLSLYMLIAWGHNPQDRQPLSKFLRQKGPLTLQCNLIFSVTIAILDAKFKHFHPPLKLLQLHYNLSQLCNEPKE